MKTHFKRLYFVYERYGGGATMGCYQPSYVANRDKIINASVISLSILERNVHNYKDSLFIFFKKNPTLKIANALNEGGNTFIYYTGDLSQEGFVNFLESDTSHLQGVIVGSQKFKDKIINRKKDTLVDVIPANHDIFLESAGIRENKKFSLYYGGSPDYRGYLCQGELGLRKDWNYTSGYFNPLQEMIKQTSNSSFESREEYFKEKSIAGKCHDLQSQLSNNDCPLNYSCHYAVRSPWTTTVEKIKNNNMTLDIPYGSQWFTKTGGKLSTAAACNANVITSLDPSVRELIDENYPYAIDTEHNDFRNHWQEICDEVFARAKEEFGTSKWNTGLKILKDVRVRTKTSRIVSDYVNFGIKIREQGQK